VVWKCEGEREEGEGRREKEERTEKDVLVDDGLLGEAAKGAGFGGVGGGDLFLDSGPGEVDIEEQEEDAQSYDGGLHGLVSVGNLLQARSLGNSYIETIIFSH
jgi:hypothetical protein